MPVAAKPRTPQDLHTHACIGRRYPSGAHCAWAFSQSEDAVEVEVSRPVIVDDRSLIMAAALDGVGLAQIHEALVTDFIESGELVRALEDWCPVLPRFLLYYTGRRHVAAPLRTFVDPPLGDRTARDLPLDVARPGPAG